MIHPIGHPATGGLLTQAVGQQQGQQAHASSRGRHKGLAPCNTVPYTVCCVMSTCVLCDVNMCAV